VEALCTVAEGKGVSVAQVAIAWVAAQGDIVPLVGARRRDRLAEALGAAGVTLTVEDLAAIEQAVPAGAAAGNGTTRSSSATSTANARPTSRPPYGARTAA
jgi:aryl-alcohol dehydrogenase-like predicted oxidoreductase